MAVCEATTGRRCGASPAMPAQQSKADLHTGANAAEERRVAQENNCHSPTLPRPPCSPHGRASRRKRHSSRAPSRRLPNSVAGVGVRRALRVPCVRHLQHRCPRRRRRPRCDPRSIRPPTPRLTPSLSPLRAGPGLQSLARALGGWDGVHFQAIAARGYRREHAMAFFPGYPLLLRWAHLALSPAIASLALSALVAQCAACQPRHAILQSLTHAPRPRQIMFPLAAALLWRLGRARVRSPLPTRRVSLSEPNPSPQGLTPRAADAAVLLLCASPATPFLVASYSELCVSSTSPLPPDLTLCFAPSHCRLFLLLVCGAELAVVAATAARGWRRSYFVLVSAACWLGAAAVRSNGSLLVLARLAALSVIHCNGHIRSLAAAAVAAAATALAPAAVHAWRMRDRFCNGSPAPAWCHSWSPTAPYGHVQRTYWGVSLGGYYKLDQLPNFALALPCVIASVAVLAPRLALAARRARAVTRASDIRGVWRALVAWAGVEEGDPALPLSHAMYWALLIAVAVSVAHVQIVTRLVASAPSFYFALGAAVADPGTGRPYSSALAAWSLGYAGVGLALFVSFLPWT